MKKIITLLLAIGGSQLCAQSVPTYSVVSVNNYYTITCAVKQISMSVVTNYTGSLTYTWTGPSFTAQSAAATVTAPGVYTLAVSNGTSNSNTSVVITSNTVLPVSTPGMTFIPGGSATVTAISPTVNITHYIYSPNVGTPMTSTLVTTIFNTSPGTYTHCLVNNASGCSSCGTYTPGVNQPGGTGIVKIGEDVQLFSAYPNPTTGVFKITPFDPSVTSIKVYNSVGEAVKVAYTLAPELSVSLGDAVAGVYTIVLDRKNRTRMTLRVVRI